MDEQQLASLHLTFTPGEIKQREGNFGKTIDYLETHTVIQRLNDALAGDWSFTIEKYEIREDVNEVIVLGRLDAADVSKMQIGSAQLKRNRTSGEPVSIGDDLKAAASDSLKKCATLLGVGLHLYRNNDSTQKTTPTTQKGRTPSPMPVEPSQSGDPRSNGRFSQGRLSSKQQQLILKLATENGISNQELNRYCQKNYGRVIDFLPKTDASKLIETLFAGQIQAA